MAEKPKWVLTGILYMFTLHLSTHTEELNDRGTGRQRQPNNTEAVMESWRIVWREGFVPVLSTNGLQALRDALRGDDHRLTQGSTTTPPPLMCVQDWPVEGACALGVCGWLGDGLGTVGEVEEHFARCCFEADDRLGEPAACRWFLNWFDDTPRAEMRRELLAEVELALATRVPATAEADSLQQDAITAA